LVSVLFLYKKTGRYPLRDACALTGFVYERGFCAPAAETAVISLKIRRAPNIYIYIYMGGEKRSSVLWFIWEPLKESSTIGESGVQLFNAVPSVGGVGGVGASVAPP
jgi:hypothetical protein